VSERSLGIDYRPTTEKPASLDMKERILVLLHEQDTASGRTDEVSGWHNDLRQAIFMFSPRFIHSAELTFLTLISWEEAKPYGSPIDQYDPGIALPPEIAGVATIPERTRQRFRLALRTLLRQSHIHAFVSGLRAVKCLGGKKVPVPELWSSENRNKLSEIVALSLTMQGFQAASELAAKHRTMHPWQIHRFLVLDEVFARWCTGRDSKERAASG
jgi:hypothetical protein